MSKNAIDYTKYFARIANRRTENLIRKLINIYLTGEGSKVSFAGGMPNGATFPFAEFSMTLKDGAKLQMIDQDLTTALQYNRAQGVSPLVKLWQELQTTWHSPKYNSWDVCFVTGSQEGCSKIFELFVEEGEPVMVQAPTYPGILGALLPLQPDFIGITQDHNGIIPEEIMKVCEERIRMHRPTPKLLYVNPTAANPTGTILTEDRRRKVYQLAQKYDFLIVEDDPYYFLNFLNYQPTSLLSLDTDGRVIRLDSFSKIMSSGIRLGTVTAHKDIITKVIRHLEGSTLHTSSMSQMIVYKLLNHLSENGLQKHFQEIQEFYQKKRDIMSAALDKHFKGIAEWSVPQGGMFFWVKVTVIDDVYDLVMKKCVPNGVLVLPGHAFNQNPELLDPHLRLSYSFAEPQEVEKGLSTIAQVIREEMGLRNGVKK